MPPTGPTAPARPAAFAGRAAPLVAALALVLGTAGPAGSEEAGTGDWPQLLGPRRDGVYRGGAVRGDLPEGGPRVLWSTEVGQGFAGPAVATPPAEDGELSRPRLVLFHRRGEREVVDILDATTGRPLASASWSTAYEDRFGFDEGPRAVPTVAGGRIYCHGAEGRLVALDLRDGREIWAVDTRERFGRGLGYFGAASSPLVAGGRVILHAGGAEGSGIAAFDAGDGSVLWTATDHEAGYSSPVAARVGGTERIVSFTREGLVVLAPGDGRVLVERRWRARIAASVNAACPVVADDLVFVSACYRTGALCARMAGDGLEELWSDDETLSCHYATPVRRGGLLFGFHGRQEYVPELRCVELETGRVRWKREGFGGGSLILAGERLVILGEEGELVLARATGAAWQELDRARILDSTARALPALAHGRLYARGEERLVCVDLRPPGAGGAEADGTGDDAPAPDGEPSKPGPEERGPRDG